MIGRRSDKEIAASAMIARVGALLIVLSIVGLGVGSTWLFLPLLDASRLSRWGVMLTLALLAVVVGLSLVAAARRRFRAAIDRQTVDIRDAIQGMADGMLVWGRDRRLAGWNERLFEHLPHLRGLLELGMDGQRLTWLAIRAAHPEWDEAKQREWVAQRTTRKPHEERVEILELADGRKIEMTQRRTESAGVVVLYRDVTERERSLRAIAASEERFRVAISSMGEGLALWDRDGRLLLWNQRYLDILPNVAPHARVGITLAELNRLAARTAYPEWSEAQIEALVERRLRSRREPGVPFELAFDDGRIVEIVDHVTPEGGHVSIFRDVTQARRAAAELAASEARFRDGIESMADGFIMWDAQDRLVAWNEQVKRMLPYMNHFLRRDIDRRELVRSAIYLAQPDWTEAEQKAWVDQRLASLKDPNFKPPLIRTVEGRVIEMTDRPTSAGGSVTLYRDVTDRERHAAELERALQVERAANLQQRRFIAVASHEFRTPLAIIDGATQRLMARLVGADEEIVRRLHRIRAAVARMTGLTEVTLSSARLEAGQLEIKPTTFDLGEMLAELRDRQASVTPDFTIEIVAPPGPVEVEADRQLIEQALGNMLGNAIKYSGESRRVLIRLMGGASAVSVAVRDYGVGIPAEELPQLFTRFFRASTSRSVTGTGIGLHFAREIVALHGGEITVASELGAGSTFTMRLPRRFSGRRPAQAAD